MGSPLRKFLFYSLIILIGGFYAFPFIEKFAEEKKIVSFFKTSSFPLNEPFLQEDKIDFSSESSDDQECKEKGLVVDVNLIPQLFSVGQDQLPIVETITYTPSVSWLSGRSAWIADYAAYYHTSCHFIARSLNQHANYTIPKVSTGKKFNVFKKDKPFQFLLLIDLSTRSLAFYYIDLSTKEQVLLKTYPVIIGKQVLPHKESLTPVGQFLLGDKIAVYKPGVKGTFHDQNVDMISVFGTRWIPFGHDLGHKGTSQRLGLHGLPWTFDAEQNKWVEMDASLCTQGTEGSIAMASADIEELFSIVITHPTMIKIVKHVNQAHPLQQEDVALQKE
ncbi:MAG: L,D-transpeptidase [Candidatus Rhabdochlamydia sp.]